jgi:hypothetical protein
MCPECDHQSTYDEEKLEVEKRLKDALNRMKYLGAVDCDDPPDGYEACTGDCACGFFERDGRTEEHVLSYPPENFCKFICKCRECASKHVGKTLEMECRVCFAKIVVKNYQFQMELEITDETNCCPYRAFDIVWKVNLS